MKSIVSEGRLANGLRVFSVHNPDTPGVFLNVALKAGYRYEKPEERGYAHILEHMFFKGSALYPTRRALALAVERKGGYQNGSTSVDHVEYPLEVSDDHAAFAFELLADMLLHPLLKEEELTAEKPIILKELNERRENDGAYFARMTSKVVLQGHPLAHNILDTEATTESCTVAGLRAYYDRYYIPNNAALIVGGSLPHARVMEMAEVAFGGWQQRDSSIVEHIAFTPQQLRASHIERDTKQMWLSWVFYGPQATSIRELDAFGMVRTMLTGGMASILKEELRQKRSLVYGVGSSVETYADLTLYSIDTSTLKAEEVIAVVEYELAQLGSRVTPELLEEIRLQRISGFKLSRAARPMAALNELVDDWLEFDRSVSDEEFIARLQAVTYADVQDVIARYLRYDNSMLVSMGPQAPVRPEPKVLQK